MRCIKTTFCAYIVLSFPTLMMAEETPTIISPATQEQKQKIELKREELSQQRKKAALLKDDDTIVVLNNLDKYLEAQALCFNKSEDLEIDICLLTVLKKIAAEENFVAEHYLGNMFEHSYKNHEMAIYWYERALNNSSTPTVYKSEILEDLERIKKKPATTTKPTPGSES